MRRCFGHCQTSLIDKNIKSVNTAKKYCRKMQELGIQVPKKVGKQIIYINIDLFNLRSDT